MTISLLRLHNFRNIAALEIEPSTQNLNIICGENGSGKSSILESVYYLSHGKSFRANNPGKMIKQSTDKFAIFAQFQNDDNQVRPIGVERNIQGHMRLRLAEKELSSFADLASLLPIQMIHSQSHQLLESGPQFRRKFINWGSFYHNSQFITVWRSFERALKQRNLLLSAKASENELRSWTQAVIRYGLELNQLREKYVEEFKPYCAQIVKQLLPLENFAFNYYCGWDAAVDYAEIMAKNQALDARIGYTQYGPQRADFMIKTNEQVAKYFLSRGQQKLLICAMILAQGLMLAKVANKHLIYLVDDLPSELDVQSRERLISLLMNQNTQIFITAIDPHAICDFVNPKMSMKVFHVEQGSVSMNSM